MTWKRKQHFQFTKFFFIITQIKHENIVTKIKIKEKKENIDSL